MNYKIVPVLITMLILIAGCKKDDKDSTAPVITINGSNPVTISLNDSYSDAGATATDDHDGAVAADGKLSRRVVLLRGRDRIGVRCVPQG